MGILTKIYPKPISIYLRGTISYKVWCLGFWKYKCLRGYAGILPGGPCSITTIMVLTIIASISIVATDITIITVISTIKQVSSQRLFSR